MSSIIEIVTLVISDCTNNNDHQFKSFHNYFIGFPEIDLIAERWSLIAHEHILSMLFDQN